MDVLRGKGWSGPRVGEVTDAVSATGLIRERSEVFRMPTVERARLLHPRAIHGERMPTIDAAFQVETPAELGAA
jgi:hypothetical protein